MRTIAFFEKYPETSALRDWIKSNDPNHKDTWIRDNVPRESVFQSRILTKMTEWRTAGNISKDALIWKQGAAPYQRQGLPDIIAIIDGRFYGFEVKRPYGLGRVSGIQARTIAEIRAAGGVAEIVSFAAEVEQILRREGAWRE